MHPGACYMSRAAIASRNQGNYWGMSSLLYENQPQKEEDLLKLVEELGMDKAKFLKDMEAESTYKEIENEVSKANEMGLDATPTMFVNGEEYVGVKPYYELKDILIEHGAKKR